jgi:glycosyltransferase involved in cell wall biosynthesis
MENHSKRTDCSLNVPWGRPIFEPKHSSLAVCICTFKRPDGLLRLLAGLDGQVFAAVPQPSVCLIVVDNSPTASAAASCAAHPSRWPLHYLHEPQPGISHARNTALAAVPAGTDFIAMIDDDEVPAPDWLDQLLAAQARSGADVIVGPTAPIFPPATPGWVAANSLFIKPENQASLHDLDPDPPAATCNVLVRAGLLGPAGLSFEPALALSGGEDKLLFQSLKQHGHTFAFAAAAHVSEWIPPERATFAYMWRESYRRGCVKYFVKQRLKSRSRLGSLRIAVRLVVKSLGLIAWHLLGMLAKLGRKDRSWIPSALHVADSLGTIAGTFQIPNRHYRPKDVKC